MGDWEIEFVEQDEGSFTVGAEAADSYGYLRAEFGPGYEMGRWMKDQSLGLAEEFDSFEDSLVGYIVGAEVEESIRGEGLGSSLLEAALAKMDELGILVTYVIPMADDPEDQESLEAWYGRNGFQDHEIPWVDSPVMIRESPSIQDSLTTGVLKKCKKADKQPDRPWCIYKHQESDEDKALKKQPKGWPKHYRTKKDGERALDIMERYRD